MWPSHLSKGGVDDPTILVVVEEGTYFSFGDRGKDIAYDVGNNIYGDIEKRGGYQGFIKGDE